MRALLLALSIMACAPVSAQAADVTAKADFTWTIQAVGSLTGQPPYTLPLTGADALTKIQAWVSANPIPDAPTTPPVDLAPTATSYTYTTTVPNGSTLYGRFRQCTAKMCGILSPVVSKAVSVVVPGVPTGVAVTVTVTVSTTP